MNKNSISITLLTLIFILSFQACESPKGDMEPQGKLFQLLDAQSTGVSFANNLNETDTLNYFNYAYIYMGGGVSVEDFNNDGHLDLYFTGNMVDNKLYLGKGDLQFEDVTDASGVAGGSSWMQGSTTCDVNSDGLLDIYVSVSGLPDECPNLLFVNQGNDDKGIPQFKEQANEYGLADVGHSTQGTFFDYDNDGDLDLYVANYPPTKFNAEIYYYDQMIKHLNTRYSDHLYRNDGNGTYTDVTEEAGVLNFGLALSATASDVNNDGWLDLYVSNDFVSPDFLYINNGDGTFTDQVKTATKQTSYYGMGADAGDFNNDGFMDLIQVDMAPEDNRRSKANMSGMNPPAFYEMVRTGFHHQYMYNSLQVSHGLDDNNLPIYRNIGWMAGLSSTDWSWAPLFADFDNDGWKDIFISNGTRRDINNNDFFKKLKKDDSYFESFDYKETFKQIDKMPSEPLANYIYKNEGDLNFTNKTEDWGIDQKGFSNGAVYADLDGDGDLDLVVNNIDSEATLYENVSAGNQGANYLSILCAGPKDNPKGLGAKVTLWEGGQLQVAEMNWARGFQSSVPAEIHFGLGANKGIDSLEVVWPGGARQMQYQVEGNQKLTLSIGNAIKSNRTEGSNRSIFASYSTKGLSGHAENEFNDFDKQVLLPHKMSQFGPALAVGDINSDGLDDLFLGGALGSNARILKQNAAGGFDEIALKDTEPYESIDAIFLDVDGDNDLDLYVVNGGNEYEAGSEYYQDQLFLNEGGNMVLSKGLPALTESGSCVRPFDYDKDGDLDLFVGSRHTPHNYPTSGTSYLLENQLKESGAYTDVTDKLGKEAGIMGMVTDATWTDMNGDGQEELFVVGEWMPLTVYEYDGTSFSDVSDTYFEGNTTGWWFSIESADFDKDGNPDFVLGNLGRNYKYQARKEASFNLYASDFDGNGQTDIVLSYHNFGGEFPVRGRQCSSQQVPDIKKEFKDYNAFSTAGIADIYDIGSLDESQVYKVESFASIYLSKNADGKYESKVLPSVAQTYPINDVLIDDYDQDGNLDMIVAGNLYVSEVETPRADAGIGTLMLGDGQGGFSPQSMAQSGIYIPHDTKKLASIKIGENEGIAVGNNNGPLQIFTKNQ